MFLIPRTICFRCVSEIRDDQDVKIVAGMRVHVKCPPLEKRPLFNEEMPAILLPEVISRRQME